MMYSESSPRNLSKDTPFIGHDDFDLLTSKVAQVDFDLKIIQLLFYWLRCTTCQKWGKYHGGAFLYIERDISFIFFSPFLLLLCFFCLALEF